MAVPLSITTRLELDRAFDSSHEQPVFLFKHSTSCSISVMAAQTYREFVAGRSAEDGVLYTFLEIQVARDVSREIAEKTGVRHESPQALLLKDGRAHWHASHWDISEEALASALESATA